MVIGFDFATRKTISVSFHVDVDPGAAEPHVVNAQAEVRQVEETATPLVLDSRLQRAQACYKDMKRDGGENKEVLTETSKGLDSGTNRLSVCLVK